ncbi:type II secretion system secretin GspD [Janthinobacterium sp. B9-8]|uniref:type II secretion system secretin GspD n=1 Tax=Janthinobacterium sp. B9-8 TaxID=1236179 RepID=UPI00061CFF95|nr:type II secretion system secretin GspD [Janthinobacterium sp. B9-8]AMC33318.1 type II secretion system protein GspD [Janthinobacterium sp. B9-8]
MILRPFLLACLLASQLSIAADDKVTLNFVNADIESTIKAIGLISGKNFVIDPRVKGTLNIVSSQAVSKEMVFPILLSALRQQGFTAVESSGVVKVLPEADAKQHYSSTGNRSMRLAGDKMVTQVYPLKYESAVQMVPILRPLISPNNTIAAYPGGNTLVITDYADNIRRLNQIIERIDQPASSDVFSVSLKYASAVDVAQNLGRLMPEIMVQGVNQGAPLVEGVKRSVVVADLRSNSLLVRSENILHAQQIKKLAATMDTQGSSGGNIHVVYLKNAEAAKLANTLKGIMTGQDSGSSSTTPSSSMAASPAGGMPASAPAAPTSAAANVQVGGVNVMIQADNMTNSLVITAPDNIYNNLRTVIDKLDVRRAQVYVEAMIAEVNVSKAGAFGVQWLLAGGNDNVSAVGAASLNGLGSLLKGIATKDPSVIPGGLSLGILNGNPVNGRMPTLGVLASALQDSGDGNVLSTPNLMTLDNEEAKIMVGQNIPIITGTQASSGANANPFVSIERKDVGIKLRVRPQVSEGGSITLTVYQEVSSIDKSVLTDGAGLATKTRSIDSKVLVDDGQIIVLGGLIEDRVTYKRSQVPLLGDIPYLGAFFRYEDRKSEKVNLMVFLRPVVLRDANATRTLSSDRYQYLRAEQNHFERPTSLVLPDMPAVVLPEVIDARKATPLTPSEPVVAP